MKRAKLNAVDARQKAMASMIEELRVVVSEAESLTAEQQRLLAAAWEQVLEDLAEQEWDALLSKPGSRQFLKDLVAEGRRQHAAGETEQVAEDTLG